VRGIAAVHAGKAKTMWDSPMHLLIVAIVILVLFGGRKIPELMRGLGEGVRGFKEGMSGNPQAPAPPAQASTTPPPAEEKKA
jgi:sec-independent protein translocase protein TatA